MTRGVVWYLVGSLVLVALIVLAGCSHYLLAEREPWRHEAEVACLNTGVENEAPGRVRVSAIEGPGACGMDYPLRVSELGASAPLSYDDDTLRPPASIPNASLPPQWQAPPASQPIQSSALPALQAPPQSYPAASYPPPQTYPAPQTYSPGPATAQAAAPLLLDPPGVPPTGDNDDDDIGIPGGPPHPYYGGPSAPLYAPRPPQNDQPPLGQPGAPMVAAAGPVQVQPPATLACPIVSALDRWISDAVQPAAMKWFRQPVVEIKQISAYSCRGMNGNPSAHISEHAFGNALDIAEFDLADGHKISVQYGWHGTPEEQGFLHDVQGAACQNFTTVLAPGANVYHYNHIHVDLMRRSGRPYICEPGAIPGEVAAARARSQFAAQHAEPRFTGSIKPRKADDADEDGLPDAEPGED